MERNFLCFEQVDLVNAAHYEALRSVFTQSTKVFLAKVDGILVIGGEGIVSKIPSYLDDPTDVLFISVCVTVVGSFLG